MLVPGDNAARTGITAWESLSATAPIRQAGDLHPQEGRDAMSTPGGSNSLADLVSRLWRDGQANVDGRPRAATARAADGETATPPRDGARRVHCPVSPRGGPAQ